MQAPYNLPPKDLLFKMLDKDLKLIIKNYGSAKTEAWTDIYQSFINKEHSARPRETALNSIIEKPRIVPDSFTKVQVSKSKPLRNRSVGSRRPSSSASKRSRISAYKLY